VVSRFWPLCLVRLLPHVGDTARSKSKPLADQISTRTLAAAGLWCFAPMLLYALVQPPLALGLGLVASALASLWMARWFARRLQGFTGDCLGATQQISEIAFYLGAAVAVLRSAG
jgi:adenosylcobinamide-GDP ribazoletransferase